MRKHIVAALLVWISVSVLGATSCTPIDPGAANNPKKRLDQATVAAIQSQITSDPRMAGARVTVSGARESIVLSGTVQNDEQRSIAEQLAKAYDPDLQVKNELKTDSTSPSSSQALPGY